VKIFQEEGLIKFIPDSDDETQALSMLWQVLIDCVKFNKKLVPVGEYVPFQKNEAHFTIEE
jgi:hypothetical protein